LTRTAPACAAAPLTRAVTASVLPPSPDGRSVCSWTKGTRVPPLARDQGGRTFQLTLGQVQDTFPRWSPDGARSLLPPSAPRRVRWGPNPDRGPRRPLAMSADGEPAPAKVAGRARLGRRGHPDCLPTFAPGYSPGARQPPSRRFSEKGDAHLRRQPDGRWLVGQSNEHSIDIAVPLDGSEQARYGSRHRPRTTTRSFRRPGAGSTTSPSTRTSSACRGRRRAGA
jgi:hypothetical protein